MAKPIMNILKVLEIPVLKNVQIEQRHIMTNVDFMN